MLLCSRRHVLEKGIIYSIKFKYFPLQSENPTNTRAPIHPINSECDEVLHLKESAYCGVYSALGTPLPIDDFSKKSTWFS